MSDKFDYSIKDSSLWVDTQQHALYRYRDDGLYTGIVREEREVGDGTTRYIVEVMKEGKQIPLSCVCMTRFGGVHNFEEYRIRPWLVKPALGTAAPPASASTYDLRSGDQVIVSHLNGQGREGVILGGIRHQARTESTERGDIAYHSCFQGLETTISSAGAYKIQFNGVPVNTNILEVLPTGAAMPAPEFNTLIAGSYFEFDDAGNFIVTDGTQSIKINKDETSGSIEILSGGNTITIGGTETAPEISVATGTLSIETQKDFSVKASKGVTIEGSTADIKAQKITIGNGSVELLALIAELVDAIGALSTISPVGNNTPLMSSPLWAKVEATKAKLAAITG